MKTDLRAYMAYALVLSGTESNATIVDSVWNQRSTLTSYGKALLGLAMAQINDAAQQRSGEAVGRRCQAGRRAGVVADRHQQPDGLLRRHHSASHRVCFEVARSGRSAEARLLPKAALYLVNHRSEGYYWDSTQQTAMVIYGLTDYLQRTQELKPNFSVDVQVNGKTVATKKFTAADVYRSSNVVSRSPNRSSRREPTRFGW